MFTCLSHKMAVSVTRPQSSSWFFVLSKSGISSPSLSYMITNDDTFHEDPTSCSPDLGVFVGLAIPGLLQKKLEVWPPSKTFSGLCRKAVCSQRSLSRLHLFLSKPPVVQTLRGFEAGGDTLLRCWPLMECWLERPSLHQSQQFQRYSQLCSQDGFGRLPSFIWDICKDESLRGERPLIWGFSPRVLLDREENTSTVGDVNTVAWDKCIFIPGCKMDTDGELDPGEFTSSMCHCHTRVFYLGFYCCDRTPWPREAWGGESLFHPVVAHHSLSLRDVRTDPQTGQEPRDRGWCRDHGGTLACSHGLLSMLSLKHPGPPAQEWYNPNWARSSHINHQSRQLPTGQPSRAFSQLRFPLPKWVWFVSSWQRTSHHREEEATCLGWPSFQLSMSDIASFQGTTGTAWGATASLAVNFLHNNDLRSVIIVSLRQGYG